MQRCCAPPPPAATPPPASAAAPQRPGLAPARRQREGAGGLRCGGTPPLQSAQTTYLSQTVLMWGQVPVPPPPPVAWGGLARTGGAPRGVPPPDVEGGHRPQQWLQAMPPGAGRQQVRLQGPDRRSCCHHPQSCLQHCCCWRLLSCECLHGPHQRGSMGALNCPRLLMRCHYRVHST